MTTKRDLRKEKNREAILEAALEIAREETWEKVTIRKIADRILYTPPIVYEHFKNKDDLLRQLVEQGFRQLNESTMAVLESDDAPGYRLKKMMEVRLAFNMEHTTVHQLMFDFSQPDWQREIAMKHMGSISEVALQAIMDHSGADEELAQEYFMNMVALVMGYTTLVSHFLDMSNHTQEMKAKMQQRLAEGHKPPLPMLKIMAPDGKQRVQGMFNAAFDRFLNSIKNNM
ncbi:MAG TPA: hypothetical protein DCE41_03015 [Cytophagales bacterium]|nr:hypothetical protein [Cytophagales bacterium]HAP62557.1 hypothetical protein [Cytophagales bacterium]